MSLLSSIIRLALRIYTYKYRKHFASLSRSVSKTEKKYTPPKDIQYQVFKEGDIVFEKLVPKNASGYALQFHGGGYTSGMNYLYRKVAEKIALKCQCTVISIDYHFGEQQLFPLVHDSCFKIYCYLLQNDLKNQIFFAFGDSFGANLLLSTCLKARQQSLRLPNKVILISPYIDMSASGASYKFNCYNDPLYSLPKKYKYEQFAEQIKRISPYCNHHQLDDSTLSPLFAKYDEFPKTLILAGGYETSLSDSVLLAEKMKKVNILVNLNIFPKMWHDFFYLFPFLKESKTAWKEFFKFINTE